MKGADSLHPPYKLPGLFSSAQLSPRSSDMSTLYTLSAPELSTLLWAIPALFVAHRALKALKALLAPLSSGLRNLPGPKNPSFLWGNLKEIFEGTNSSVQEAWLEKYGHVIRYRTAFGVRLSDPYCDSLNILISCFNSRRRKIVSSLPTPVP